VGAQDRHETSLQLAEELLSDIELSRLPAPQVVLKGSRLARLVRDEEAQEWLGYEINGYPHDGSDTDALERAGRWTDREKGTAFKVALSQLSAIADTEASKLAAMQVSSWSGEYVTIASREHRVALNSTARSISQVRGVEASVLALVHSWATRTYHELLFSGLQADLFGGAQTEIDGRLVPLAGSALAKIESIGERLTGGDPESVSQAMSTCRRLIDTAADALFPAQEEPYQLGEVTLSVKQNNVLNCLQAYVAEHVESKGRRDRLRRTLADMYERTSTGTHAEVDVVEARYLFLQTYVVLGELLALRPNPSGPFQPSLNPGSPGPP